MNKILLLLFPLLVFSWDAYKEIDGISIYKDHNEKFEFVQFKAETTMPFSLEKISSAIMNYKSYISWLSDCIEADRQGDNIYILMSPPWPLENRQVWAEIHKKTYSKKQIITLRSIDKTSSKNSGVWFNYLYAEFKLEYKDVSTTQVSLSLIGDPGGFTPSWIVNLIAWEIPYQSLYDLQEHLSKQD